MNPNFVKTIVVVVATTIEESARNILRNKGQKKLQKCVDTSRPALIKQDLSVTDDHIQFTILGNDNVNLSHYQELPISENEIKEWKTFISTCVGETAKTTFTISAFNGLLKCDVPLKDLCRIKDNPEAMRGFVMNNGKISKQASFSEIGLNNVAPLLIYQCMAAVTSQYYQQIITERLNDISLKLDNIIKILTADDCAKLKVSYKRFVELSKKSTYDIADKQIVSEFSGYVEIIREKYRNLLSNISDFRINYRWSDKKEAELKIQTFQNSHYFEYLDMAMQAEALTFIASAISMKVAKYLGNDEDVEIYADRMNLDYWSNYINQFNKTKHDIIKYLELEADSSWLQSKSITAMKDEQLKKFDQVENSMLNLQEKFEYRTVQYIKFQEDGSLKKYISISATNQ